MQCQYVTSIGSAMVSSGSETRTKEAHKQTKKKTELKRILSKLLVLFFSLFLILGRS